MKQTDHNSLPLRDLASVDKPREKMIRYGPEKLKTHELLALLIRSGTKGKNVLDIAQDIISYYGEKQLFDATVEELSTYDGIGRAKAVEVVAAFELAKRFYRIDQVPKCTDPAVIWQRTKHIHTKKQEHVVVFLLNGAAEEISNKTVFVGSLTTTMIHPREIYEYAIGSVAAGIVLVHNHPSGQLEPSSEDIVMTHRMKKSGTILGIPLLDHVIVTQKGYYSFLQEGMLPS